MIRSNGDGKLRSNGQPRARAAKAAAEGSRLTQAERHFAAERRPCLITGGAGFIGTNLADRLLELNHPVVLLDNLSRPHVQRNVTWLREKHGDRVRLEEGDVRDAALLQRMVKRASHVFHLAAQVAVTTSIADPVEDFDINARGTLNVLEALRACEDPPPLLFTSTNKVYGAMDNVDMMPLPKRYEPSDVQLRRTGFEPRTLDLYSPYGCSKGAADQYVLDYARTYGVPAVVFRMSCVYGPHQFGTEDQGWVAHFMIRAMSGEPIVIYGDGRQVRDVLYIDDLIDAMLLAQSRIDAVSGKAFNVGGGPRRTLSLLELIDLIDQLGVTPAELSFDDWRVGDQRYYVSSIERLREALGWEPRVGVREGVRRLHGWLTEQMTAAEDAQVSDGPQITGEAHEHGD